MSTSKSRRKNDPTNRSKVSSRAKGEVGVSPIDIDHPIGSENVDSDMGLNNVAASGSIPFNPIEFKLVGVTGTTFLPGDEPGDDQGGNAQPAMNVDADTGEWSFPVLTGASCNGAGTAANGVKIWCTLENRNTTVQTTTNETSNFTGLCVMPFAKGNATQRKRSAATPTPFPISLPGVPLEYSKKVGKWLIYRNLSVSHRHEGTLLFADGKVLRGSKISVAAEDVRWRTHDETDTNWIEVTASKGLADLGTSAWHFKDLNKFAVCVWQYGGFARVVKSETRLSPTKIVGLNPFKPLFVQVNDRTGNYADNAGSFDLWIRIDAS